MEIYLEKNARFGYGYQVRVDKKRADSDPKQVGSSKKVAGSILDDSPYTLYEAVRIAGKALDRINEQTGSTHELYQVLWLTQGGVEANACRDIASAKLAREIRSGARKYIEIAEELRGDNDDANARKS